MVFSSISPNWRKYSRTSSVAVSWLTPPTKIFFVLLSLLLEQRCSCFTLILLLLVILLLTKDAHVSWFLSFTCSLEWQAWGRWPFHPRGEKRPTTPFCFSSYFQFSSLILIDTRGNEEADRNVMKPNPRLRCNQSFGNEMVFGVIQI